MRSYLWAGGVGALFLVACGGHGGADPAGVDAEAPPGDASSADGSAALPDGGVPSGGGGGSALPDAGVPGATDGGDPTTDSGPRAPTDSGVPDAGPSTDSGGPPGTDAGPSDAGPSADAAPPPDAAADAAPPPDAAADAASPPDAAGDAGSDAAPPPPTCGHLTTTPCTAGEACAEPGDCASGVCHAKVCQAPSPTDGVQNGGETDVDCGGPNAPPCATGKGCKSASDCDKALCDGTNHCAAASCSDKIVNGSETDTDCGGSCPACPTNAHCMAGADCTSGVCDAKSNMCDTPSCSDKVKNGSETDVDCGGPSCGACATGQTCGGSTDCASGSCDLVKHTCGAPNDHDGIKNEGETDIDCGGPVAKKCDAGKTCAHNVDCASDGCDYNHKCASARSCTPHEGGDTCGDANGQEDCCKTLPVPLPTGTVNLDKYMITAGRYRQFVDRTNGNLRGYIQANRPAWWQAGWDQFLPVMLDNGGANDYTGVYEELGPLVHGTFGGGNEGCQINKTGARSYYLSPQVNSNLGDAQLYDQLTLDKKALNCVTFYMIAAFCAWDGGYVATADVFDYAWHGGLPGSASANAHTYPWGNAPAPAGYAEGTASEQAATNGQPRADNTTYTSFSFNFWDPPTEQCSGLIAGYCDETVYIPPPGRFTKSTGPFGHADIAGLVFNWTTSFGAAPATATSTLWTQSGSWEGHVPPYTSNATAGWPLTNKYIATGGRCAR